MERGKKKIGAFCSGETPFRDVLEFFHAKVFRTPRSRAPLQLRVLRNAVFVLLGTCKQRLETFLFGFPLWFYR